MEDGPGVLAWGYECKVMTSPEEGTTRGGAGVCVCVCVRRVNRTRVELITHVGHPSWKAYRVTGYVSL